MKKTFGLCLLLTCSVSLIAIAQIDSLYRFRQSAPTFLNAVEAAIQQARTINPYDTSEGGVVNNLSRFKYFMGSRVCNDVAYGTDIFDPLNMAFKTYAANINSFCPGTGKFSGQWECIGPFQNTFGTNQYEAIGRINGIWVSPNDENYILAGADAGGLWKSTDGGAHWTNITDASAGNGSSLAIPGSMGEYCNVGLF